MRGRSVRAERVRRAMGRARWVRAVRVRVRDTEMRGSVVREVRRCERGVGRAVLVAIVCVMYVFMRECLCFAVRILMRILTRILPQ